MTQNRTESGLPLVVISHRELHSHSFSFDEASCRENWFDEANAQLESGFQEEYESIKSGHGVDAANAYKSGVMQLYSILATHSTKQQADFSE